MFDLGHSISEWRRQMMAGGMANTEILRELENHLRDAVEDAVASGQDAARAFQNAAHSLGAASDLNREFAKVPAHSTHARLMKRKLTILLAALALVAIQMAFLLPAIAHARATLPPSPMIFLVALAATLGVNLILFTGLRAWFRRSPGR